MESMSVYCSMSALGVVDPVSLQVPMNTAKIPRRL